ncbi:MAG: YccF domain-containing protein [Synechococcus sp.]|uniref:YccF domain-containing protein n=1 Tax=Synechococcus sp. BMK-MC-1 TaxID=1442551 RepID=UPI001647E30D|nr:YccF domain-containing protein [Synechococcus sp. BMK-MC-1]QNI67228.1 hypothetical protein SynBMKMC1_01145 [Synechococcus sp. BMK-MC-1]
MISALFNVLWVVLGGFVMAVGWWLAGLLCAITIIGLPWARSCFVVGRFSLWPFGQKAVNRRDLSGRGDLGTGALGLIGNVLWFLVAGWWLAIGHLSSALACFITIVGIPFGIQHIKLALIALAPVGMTVVPVHSESRAVKPT